MMTLRTFYYALYYAMALWMSCLDSAPDMSFSLRKDCSGATVCALDAPSSVIVVSQSTIADAACIPYAARCGWLCRSYVNCTSYNFKVGVSETTCEFYATSPTNLSVTTGCQYFDVKTTSCPAKAINMALHRPAWSSSTFAYNAPPYYCNCTADKAVDGNNDTEIWDNFCQGTNDPAGGPNWLVVDMGDVVRLRYVVLTNRNSAAERLDYFLAGVTNTSAAIAAPVRGSYPLCGQYPTTAPASARLTLYCGASTPPARYVIIQQPSNGTGWMTVCELEIYT